MSFYVYERILITVNITYAYTNQNNQLYHRLLLPKRIPLPTFPNSSISAEMKCEEKIIPSTSVNRKTIFPQHNLFSTTVWIKPPEYLLVKILQGKKFKFFKLGRAGKRKEAVRNYAGDTNRKQTLKFLMLNGILEHISETKDRHTWLSFHKKSFTCNRFSNLLMHGDRSAC